MSSVEEDIRRTVNQPRAGGLAGAQLSQNEDFAKLRAHLMGELIAAKRQLVPGDEWLITDMRIVDIVFAWLDQNRR